MSEEDALTLEQLLGLEDDELYRRIGRRVGPPGLGFADRAEDMKDEDLAELVASGDEILDRENQEEWGRNAYRDSEDDLKRIVLCVFQRVAQASEGGASAVGAWPVRVLCQCVLAVLLSSEHAQSIIVVTRAPHETSVLLGRGFFDADLAHMLDAGI